MNRETGHESDTALAAEAQGIVNELAPIVDRLRDHEAGFVSNLAERFEEYGARTIISPKQLFWLRDLKEKYL